MFLIITFKKSFKNVMLVPFQVNFLIKNINLKHDLRMFLVILLSKFFIGKLISKYYLVMNFQS
jgi:hypothetical protein